MNEHLLLYFLSWAAGVAVGTLVYRFTRDYISRHKYRWKCSEDGCSFKMSTSDGALMEALIASHLTKHPRSNWPE